MFLTKSQVEIRVNYVMFEALNVRILRINKLAGTTMLLNLVWGNVGSEKSRLGLDVSNSTLCSSSGERMFSQVYNSLK